MDPATLGLITMVISAVGPLLAAWAHYRINKAAPVTPATPGVAPLAPGQPLTIGHGLLLELFRQALAGGAAQPAPDPLANGVIPPPAVAPVASAAPGITGADLVNLVEKVLEGFANFKAIQSAQPLAAPAKAA